MMKILYFYLSGLLLLWSSCQRPTMLDFALRYAGENRVELEKVLDHYRNDSLKYRAAVFLIGNMPYHISIQVRSWIASGKDTGGCNGPD